MCLHTVVSYVLHLWALCWSLGLHHIHDLSGVTVGVMAAASFKTFLVNLVFLIHIRVGRTGKCKPRVPQTPQISVKYGTQNLAQIPAFSVLLISQIIHCGNDFYCWYIWEINFPLSFLDFLCLLLILIIYCLTRGIQAAHAVPKIRGAFIPQGYCLL